MKAKVERLRVGLVAGTLLLLVVVVGALGYSRYRAGRAWFKKLKDHSGASLIQETDGFTYSQSLQGRTLFTLHAAKAFQHADGQYTLHDVVITVYGAHDGRADRIYGKEFEWDEAKGIARALGDTEMDLQVPAATATRQRASAGPVSEATGADGVHVKTSGLMFLRKLGVAATTELIEIRYGGLNCTAKGAEFDSNPSELHLLADVHVSGMLRGSPVSLAAMKADFARDTNVATFMQPRLVSADQRAQANTAVLHLRSDGSIEHAEGFGGVAVDDGIRHVTSSQMDAVLNEKNEMQSARLSGGVKLIDASKEKPVQGEAGEMLVRFDRLGQPAEVTAIHSAHVLMRQAASNGARLNRELKGDSLQATLVAQGNGGAQLQKVHVVGSASMHGDSLAAAAGTHAAELISTSVTADDLLANFISAGAKAVRLEKVHAQGNAVLLQKGTAGEERTSSADALDVLFAPAENATAGKVEVAFAVEDGHVTIRSRTPAKAGTKSRQDDMATGSADHAMYDGAAEQLTLTGNAHFSDAATWVTAESVVLEQGSCDAEARGNVVATLAGNGAQATHVSAQHALLHRLTQTAEFEGTEVRPARMWQEASQVEAATILLDGKKHTLLARPGEPNGKVHSVFAGERKVKPGNAATPDKVESASGDVLRVESRQVEYSDANRQAVFLGPVFMDGAAGEVRARRATAFFAPAETGKRGTTNTALPVGSLERVVASGEVRVAQQGREGSGDILTYRSLDNSFTLTGLPGAPPRIVDVQQGSVTGASLLFRPGNSTIVVSGEPPSETKHSRARIDTKVRQ